MIKIIQYVNFHISIFENDYFYGFIYDNKANNVYYIFILKI